MSTETTWVAAVVDDSGFVIDDELLRAWADAIKAGKSGWGVPCEPPQRIHIVKGSAVPMPQSDDPDEKYQRMPSSYYTDDEFLTIENLDELDEDEPERVVLYWERAQAAAAGLNMAGVR